MLEVALLTTKQINNLLAEIFQPLLKLELLGK
jgi:hypothetical protein